MLFVDKKAPRFDHDAGSRQMLAYLRLFQSKGYKIYFWSHDIDRIRFYRTYLKKEGIVVINRFPFLFHFKRWITAFGPDLDVAFLSRPQIAVHYLDEIKRHSFCKVVYYGHDLHVYRMNMQNRFEPGCYTQDQINQANRWEEECWEKSDLILYPSQEEVDAVKASKPNRQAAVLPLACASDSEINAGITPTPFSDRLGLLFVGFFAHKPNKDAMLWFLDQVYPIILKHCPDMPVVIAGGEPPEELTLQANDRVTVTGMISDEELRKLYSRARISIAPLRIGAGVKGKVVESLKMGVPVATTSIGIQGLRDTEQAIAVGDTPEALADAVIKLHSDESTWISFRESGIQYYREHFSAAAVSDRVLPLLRV